MATERTPKVHPCTTLRLHQMPRGMQPPPNNEPITIAPPLISEVPVNSTVTTQFLWDRYFDPVRHPAASGSALLAVTFTFEDLYIRYTPGHYEPVLPNDPPTGPPKPASTDPNLT